MAALRRVLALLIVATTSSFATPALCWGDDGHRIVGEIAVHYLTPAAQRAVSESLSDAQYSTLAEAATWPDTYARNVPSYAWANPMHYVNVDSKAQRYVAARDCPASCVVTAIESYRGVLRSPAREEEARRQRQEALYFVAHFIGDIHQPLHVAHPDGRGGNSTWVAFFGERRRAHWVWDEGLIVTNLLTPRGVTESSPSSLWEWTAFTLRMEITPEEARVWQRDLSPEKWTNEALALAQHHAALRDGERIDTSYTRRKWPVIKTQLKRAGVRLAGVLNEAFAAHPATIVEAP